MAHSRSVLLFTIVLISTVLRSAPAAAQHLTQMGWPASLTEIYNQLNKQPRNYFIIISRLPSIAVDFRSPNGMRNSINSFSFQKNFHPGHELIGWKCNIGGAPFESMMGFTGESQDQHNDLLRAGWGLSSLLATFKDGFVQIPSELESRLQSFQKENEESIAAGKGLKIYLIATVFEISENDCENVVNEVFEYIDHPKNPTQNFSLILSPDTYDGAGCGSFASHFMERIGSLAAFPKLFRRQFHLPNYLFGTGAYLPDDVEIPEKIQRLALPKTVSKLQLITQNWSSTVSPNIDVEMTDPELIVFWQKLFFQAYFDQNNLNSQKKTFNKKLERGFWERLNDDSGSYPAQTRYVTIDKHYDDHTRKIISHQAQLLQGTKLTLFSFLNFPGIVLEKK